MSVQQQVRSDNGLTSEGHDRSCQEHVSSLDGQNKGRSGIGKAQAADRIRCTLGHVRGRSVHGRESQSQGRHKSGQGQRQVGSVVIQVRGKAQVRGSKCQRQDSHSEG